MAPGGSQVDLSTSPASSSVPPVVCPLWKILSSNPPQTIFQGLPHALYLHLECLSPTNGTLPSSDSTQMLPSVSLPNQGSFPQARELTQSYHVTKTPCITLQLLIRLMTDLYQTNLFHYIYSDMCPLLDY